MTTNFMTICPRTKEYIGCNITGIPLKVIQSSGVELTPNIDFKDTVLSNGAKYFHNNSGEADSFTIECIINSNDKITITKDFEDYSWQENPSNFEQYIYRRDSPEITATAVRTEPVTKLLDYYIRNGEPFYITSRANGIEENELWLVTENKSRKQDYDDGYSVWSLTFTKYIEYTFATFKNENKGVTKALNNYAKKKAKAKSKAKSKAKTKTSTKKKMKKCNIKQLEYSKNKKVVKCVKIMQKILYNHGCLKKKEINGWYDKTTIKAVKKFQKKYAKKYKLKQTGKIDKSTFKALYSA